MIICYSRVSNSEIRVWQRTESKINTFVTHYVHAHVFADNKPSRVGCLRTILQTDPFIDEGILLFIPNATRTIPGRLVPRRLMTRDVYLVNNREDWNVCAELQANRERETEKKIENATRLKDSNPLGEDREMAKGEKHGEH